MRSITKFVEECLGASSAFEVEYLSFRFIEEDDNDDKSRRQRIETVRSLKDTVNKYIDRGFFTSDSEEKELRKLSEGFTSASYMY